MKSEQQTNNPKLLSIASAVSLALLLTTNANAAEDPNFPTLGEMGANYLNNVNASTPGLNLAVNPTIDVCIKDVEANVFTPDPASTCDTDADFTWGYSLTTTTTDTSDASSRAIVFADAAKKLDPVTYSIDTSDGNSKVYFQFDAKVAAAAGTSAARVRLKVPKSAGGFFYFNVDLPTVIGNWEKHSLVMDLSTKAVIANPFIGDIEVLFIGVTGNTVYMDNFLLFTDNELNNQVGEIVDTDGDGLSDDDEINIYGTDPTLADTDGDNLSDGEEVNTYGTNPLEQDSDGDGSNDDVEIAAGTDPNDIDNFPGDADSDGVNDDSDDFPNDISASVDSDSDGYPDAYNDACDQACQDASSLEIDAFADNEVAFADMDNDGEPDGFIQDYCKEGGLPEGDDLSECGGLTLDLDRDGDGDSNADEMAAGSSPGDPDSTLLDLDGDSWANDNDAYPKLALLSQPTTNALLSHGFDAESNTEAWTTFGSSKLAWTADIVNVTGHNENATNAFHLLPEATEGKNLSHRGPLLTPAVGEIVQQVRLAGWVKIDVADGITPSKILFRLANTHEVSPDSPKGTSFTAITLHSQEYYNQGWVYVEKQITFPAPALTSQIQLLMNQDAGVEVWFDELEFNVINNGDFDEDLVIDAIDTDDDNDDILDGVDASPLGDTALDSDLDTILDGYDDDLDNDLMVNAFDANFNPIVTDFTLLVSSESTTVTAVTNDLDAEDTLTYTWSVSGSEQAESSNMLIINHSDHDSGRQLLVNVTAFDGTDSSATFEDVVTMPGEVVNAAPFISFTVNSNDAGDQTINAEITDLDGDEFTFKWSVNGTEIDLTETSLTILFADYSAGEVVAVSLMATDGEDSSTLSQDITLNSSPELTISEVVGEDMTSTLTATAIDPENDDVSFTWFIDGQPQTDSSGEYIVSDTLEINYYDHLAGIDITVTAVASDGLSETSTDYVVDIPEASVEASEQFPEGEDGGATWWLLSLLFTTLFTRSFKAKK